MVGVPLVLFVASAVAGDPVTVRIRVHAPDVPATGRLVARTTWLGEDLAIRLTDDGTTRGDRPNDGVYVGWTSGDTVRVLPLELVLESADGTPTSLAGFNEPLDDGANDLAYAVTFAPQLSVRRVAAAWSSRTAETADLAVAGASLGWTGLVLAYVGWLVARPVRVRDRPDR